MTNKTTYDKAFKERAGELGVSDSSLGKWRRDFEKYGDNCFPGQGKERLTDEQRRIKELEKELKDEIQDSFDNSEQTYGSVRIAADLYAKGIKTSRSTVQK